MEISETNSEVNSMEENEIKLEFDEFEIDHYGDSSIEFKAKFKNTSTQIMSLQFDYDTQFLAAGTRNGTINIYNLNFCELDSQINPVDETGTIKADVNQNDVKFPVTCLKWKPKSNYSRAVSTLAACYGDGAVKFWDVTKKESKIKIEEKENNGIYSLDYNSTGSILATGGMDSSLRIYDEPTKKLVQIYSPQGCGEILNH